MIKSEFNNSSQARTSAIFRYIYDDIIEIINVTEIVKVAFRVITRLSTIITFVPQYFIIEDEISVEQSRLYYVKCMLKV